MTDGELAERLHKLVKADILAQGSSDFRYRGLGDRVFAMVFRRIYGEEIEHVSVAKIEEEFKQEIAALKGKLAVEKGKLAEHRVRYRLLLASLRGATLGDVVRDAPEPLAGVPVGPFAPIRKARFYVDLDESVEVDLHAVHKDDRGTDLMIEVKDWERQPSLDAVRRFVDVRAALAGHLERQTVFLVYSENGLSDEAAVLLAETGVLILDPGKTAGFEASGIG